MTNGAGDVIDSFYSNRNKKQYKLTINGNCIDTYTDIHTCLLKLAALTYPFDEPCKVAFYLSQLHKLNEDFDVGESGNVVMVNITEVN